MGHLVRLSWLFISLSVCVCVCVYTRFYIHIFFAKSAICPCFYYMPAIATQLLPLLLTVGLVCSSSSPLSLPFLHLHAAARLSLTRIFCVPQTVVVAFVKFSSVFLSIFTVWLLKPLFLTLPLPPHATFLLWFVSCRFKGTSRSVASLLPPPPVRPRCHSCHSNFVVVVGDGKNLGYTLCTQHFSNPWKTIK